MNKTTSPARKESLLVNILINIAIPTIILMKFSDDASLGPTWGLIIALSFPVGYGIREFCYTRRVNLFSALGFVSTLLTGGMALLHIPNEYFALKEAAIPGIFAIVTLVSIKTKSPLVKTFLYNDTIMQTSKVAQALEVRNNTDAFEKALKHASLLLALSFMLSSLLNYLLTTIILVSEPGSEQHVAELGKLQALSFPMIALPATLVTGYALYYLFKEIKKLTGLTLEQILVQH